MLMSPDHTLYEVGNGRQRQTRAIDIIKGSYTKEEGMQLIETAKFERLLKIA